MVEPPADVYGRVADEFDARTQLDELPDSFRDCSGRSSRRSRDQRCSTPGAGRAAAFFAERDLDPVGIDRAAGMVEYARANRPGRYCRMDIRHLGFAADAFDGAGVRRRCSSCRSRGWRRRWRSSSASSGPTESPGWGSSSATAASSREVGTTTVEYRIPVERAHETFGSAGSDVESVAVDEVASGARFANLGCSPRRTQPGRSHHSTRRTHSRSAPSASAATRSRSTSAAAVSALTITVRSST